MALGKIYTFGPTFRAEKSKTRRHLTEFWMLEPEIAFCDLDGLMEVEESLITHIVQSVLKDCAAELKFLGRDISVLERVVGPFPRMSYDDAAKYLIDLYEKETDPEKKELLKFEWGMDFGAPHETEESPDGDEGSLEVVRHGVDKAFHLRILSLELLVVRLELLLDCESHAPRLDDEKIVLTEYIVDKEERLARQGELYSVQQREIGRLEIAIKRFATWAKVYDNEKMAIKARSMQKRLDKMEKIEKPVTERRKMDLSLNGWRGSNQVLEFVEVSKSFISHPPTSPSGRGYR